MIELTEEEAKTVSHWFYALTLPCLNLFIEKQDYMLALKLLESTGREVPDSVKEGATAHD